MSEWLTTGEMIDRLKVGEVAKCVSIPYGRALLGDEVEYTDNRLTFRGCAIDFQINDFTQKMKWRILSKYVTFEEAMQALKKGKYIKVIYKDGSFDRLFDTNDVVDLGNATWNDILEGKWQIIE